MDMLDEGAFERNRSTTAGFTSNHQKVATGNRTNHSSSDRSIMRQNLQGLRDIEISHIEQLKKMSITKQNENVQRKKDIKFSNLVKDIAESVHLMDSIDRNILWTEEAKRNKSRRLFDDWNSRVHDPIKVSRSFLIYIDSDSLYFSRQKILIQT